MAILGSKHRTAGFNSSKAVRAKLQAALYHAKQNRLSKLVVDTGDYLDAILSSTIIDVDATISDSYSGSGSTLMAAKKLGLNAVGYELPPDDKQQYADKMVHKFQQNIMML